MDVPKAFLSTHIVTYGGLVVVTFRMLELVERAELCAKAEAVMIVALEVELGVRVGTGVIGMEAGLGEVEAEGLKV